MYSTSPSWEELDGGPELLVVDVAQSPADHLLLLPLSRDEGRWIFASATNSVAKLLSSHGVSTTRVILSEEPLYVDNRAVVWVGPVLFFSLAALVENPSIVSLALSVLANYVSDVFRSKSAPVGEPGVQLTQKVRLRVVAEVKPRSQYKAMNYEGPAEGLLALVGAIESAMRNNQESK